MVRKNFRAWISWWGRTLNSGVPAQGRANLFSVEALEARQLLAITLVQDIASGPVSSTPRRLTAADGQLFFTLTAGLDLWRTDGTASGTVSLGTFNGEPESLQAIGGTVFFSGYNANGGGRTLWKSNGGAGGTVPVAPDAARNTYPRWLTEVGGTLLFSQDAFGGRELWKSGGTANTTVLVDDIAPGSSDSEPTWITDVNGTAFFVVTPGSSGAELWKSAAPYDAANTTPVKWLPNVTNFAPIGDLTNLNGILYFVAGGPNIFNDLWRSDGTPEGTYVVSDIYPGGGANIAEVKAAGDALFFTPQTGTAAGLWQTGTDDGTFKVSDRIATNLTDVNGTLFFSAGGELWKCDGTGNGITLVRDINTSGSSNPSVLTNVGGTLFFAADDGINGRELWQSDGTPEGTTLVQDLNPGFQGSSPSALTEVNGTLFLVANDGAVGTELWRVSIDDPPPPPPPGGDPDDQISEARPIPFDQPVIDSVSEAADVDMFKITVAAGQRVGIDLDRAGGSALDTYLRLFSSDSITDAVEIRKNNNEAAPGETLGTESYLDHTFESAGTYYIGVSASGNAAYGPVSGNNGTGGTTGGYVLSVQRIGGGDTTAPTGELSSVSAPIGGTATHEFSVRYSDDEALDVGSFDNTEVAVRMPGGAFVPVVQTSLNIDGAAVATVTYRLDAPGGNFDPTDNGTYVIELRDGALQDMSGNVAPARELGRFLVALVDEPRPLTLATVDSHAGVATGLFSVSSTGPLQANLSVKNHRGIWLGVTAEHSAGAGQLGRGGGMPGLLGIAGLVNPDGEVAYTATFFAERETAKLSLRLTAPLAIAANLADILLARFGVTPETVVALAQDIQNLPAIRNATDRLATVPPEQKSWRKLAKRFANDLRAVISEKKQRQVVMTAMQRLGIPVAKKTMKRLFTTFAAIDVAMKAFDVVVILKQTGGNPASSEFRATRA